MGGRIVGALWRGGTERLVASWTGRQASDLESLGRRVANDDGVMMAPAVEVLSVQLSSTQEGF